MRSVRAAMAAAGIFVFAAPASTVAAQPSVKMKRVVRPGETVTVKARGFPAGSHVRVQFGLWSSPPSNCCVTTPMPRLGQPGLLIPDSGSRSLRVRFARVYARCVNYLCESPGLTRWRPGQAIYVSVFTDEVQENGSIAFAKRRARVSRRP